jgi:NAD(P)-dependent dehydrogenase (short-subunit alcohol dehydrogenase family)
MSSTRKAAVVTGASQGIGAGIVKGFVERGFDVVANSLKVTQSTEVAASDRVALVDGDIGDPATAARIVETALSRFQSIDVLVNNAGIFFTKPFTDYTAADIKSLLSTNVEGFLYVTQLSIKQMLAQKTGGSIVTITAALARNPMRGVTASVPMITKGGLETITQHLAMEYAKDGIRVNAVAPGRLSFRPLVIEWNFRHDHKRNDRRGPSRQGRHSFAGCANAIWSVHACRSDGQPPFPERDARHFGPHGCGRWRCRQRL